MIILPDNVIWNNTDKNTRATVEALADMNTSYKPKSWDKHDVAQAYQEQNEIDKVNSNGK